MNNTTIQVFTVRSLKKAYTDRMEYLTGIPRLEAQSQLDIILCE
jgi:hypothetical protein